MDLRKLKTILELFENSAINEMELVEGEERIRLAKSMSTPADGPSAEDAPADAEPESSQTPAEAAPEPEQLQEHADPEHPGAYVFASPMVGTYYAASAPDKPPFIEVGDTVAEGDVVCIVEAMKLMNELRAPVSGRILALHARNGEPVAFGDKLMTIG